jgi:predicted component of type VI protein secretion system
MPRGRVNAPRLTAVVEKYRGVSLGTPLIATFSTNGGRIGRSDSCDLFLPDPERLISRIQLEIAFQDGNFVTRNLGFNPAARNGEQLPREVWTRVNGGDSLTLGHYVMMLFVELDTSRRKFEVSPLPSTEDQPRPSASPPDDFDPFCAPSPQATPAPDASRSRSLDELFGPSESGPGVSSRKGVDPFADLLAGPTPPGPIVPAPAIEQHVGAPALHASPVREESLDACVEQLRKMLFP